MISSLDKFSLGFRTIKARPTSPHLSSGMPIIAIIGIPDDKWGEVGLAFIVLKPNENLSSEDIINHCLKNLAKFKIPKSVEFIEALPRNATGKVLKRTLRENKLGKSAPAIS